MFRSVLGWILALVGATAAVLSPFRTWYDGRLGRDYRIGDLFGGITDSEAGIAGSILLPFAFAALLTLAGLLLRSRLMVALAGVVVLGFTVLWMVRVGQARGGLTVDSEGTGLDIGVALAFGGGVLLMLAAAVMLGRGQRRRRVDGDTHRRREPEHDYQHEHEHEHGYDRDYPPHERAPEEGTEQRFPWRPGPGGPGGPGGPDDRPPPPDHRYR
ncbi:hypothetical protein [Streptomyces flavidovirens]|uniref:hypothetical protein n=1 Tax=Streptomyces flavidovirens TaxID=67298 RepID=UPI0036A21FEE